MFELGLFYCEKLKYISSSICKLPLKKLDLGSCNLLTEISSILTRIVEFTYKHLQRFSFRSSWDRLFLKYYKGHRAELYAAHVAKCLTVLEGREKVNAEELKKDLSVNDQRALLRPRKKGKVAD